MANVVTFQTACRLKAAGYHQPKPAKGQSWYDGDGNLFTILFFSPTFKFWGIFYWEREELNQILPDEMTFAPGFADIANMDAAQFDQHLQNLAKL